MVCVLEEAGGWCGCPGGDGVRMQSWRRPARKLSAVVCPGGGAELSLPGAGGADGWEGSDVHVLGCHSSAAGPAPHGCSRARSRDAPATDQHEPWLLSLRVSTGGRREGGQAPWPRRRSPRFPACPAEAETRQRLLRTVKKEVGAATPG